MVLYKIMLGACLVLLFSLRVALAAAQRQGDRRREYVLHLLRIGLGLSALSYLLRLVEAPHGAFSFFILVAGLTGTAFLWLGWREHWKLLAERRNARPVPGREEDVPATLPAPLPAAGSPPLTERARQALLHAQREAHLRHGRCVDTDHLLLGLLCDADSAGVQVLKAMGVGPEKIHVELLGQMPPRRASARPPGVRPPGVRTSALTDRAEQVLALAAQEAHRFGRASVGTDCLLLGLVLVGKGKAAGVLFEGGVTADGIRSEIFKAKRSA